jgi:potassium/hydrogen antiporter
MDVAGPDVRAPGPSGVSLRDHRHRPAIAGYRGGAHVRCPALAVWICLAPLRFSGKEIGYIAWVGLRGAVPIVLAIFPFMAQLPEARTIFNVAFVVVLSSLLLQGSTIAWFARRMGVLLPDHADEPAVRALFGDFVISARTPLADLCAFYGLSAPDDPELSVENWLAQTVNRPLVVGDRAMLDHAELSVRGMSEDGRVTAVGLKLTPSSEGPAA